MWFWPNHCFYWNVRTYYCNNLSLFHAMEYWLLISCYPINALKIVFHFQIAVNGQSFNRSARDAWELFQSTGIESLVAYDCSGAILLMSTILGGLITGTCMGVWTYFKQSDKAVMVGSTSMLMGMILVSANISIWICMTVVTGKPCPSFLHTVQSLLVLSRLTSGQFCRLD